MRGCGSGHAMGNPCQWPTVRPWAGTAGRVRQSAAVAGVVGGVGGVGRCR